MDDAKLIVPVVGYFRCREDSGHEDLRGIYAHGAMAFVAAASDVHPVGLDTIAGHARKGGRLGVIDLPDRRAAKYASMAPLPTRTPKHSPTQCRRRQSS
jgi:hypothetical protein